MQDNMCTIMNAGGKILFQEELDGNGIEAVLPVRGWRTYQSYSRIDSGNETAILE